MASISRINKWLTWFQIMRYMIVLGDGGHHGTVNNNGCQELPLIPPVWITSTNRHTHLIPWPFQHPIQFLDLSNIQPTWFLDLSIIQSNSLTFPTSKGKWACLLVEVIPTGGISGNSWQPLLFTVPRWPLSPSTIYVNFFGKHSQPFLWD